MQATCWSAIGTTIVSFSSLLERKRMWHFGAFFRLSADMKIQRRNMNNSTATEENGAQFTNATLESAKHVQQGKLCGFFVAPVHAASVETTDGTGGPHLPRKFQAKTARLAPPPFVPRRAPLPHP